MQKTDFYFDFLSPYSYFAWKNHERKLTGLTEVTYKPVLMGKLFDHWSIKGPGEIAPKRYSMLKSCFRYASRNKIDFIPPTTHPFNPLYALRMATSSCSGDNQKQLIDCLWDFIWAKGNTADNPERLVAALSERGLPGADLLEASFNREAKTELKKNTKEALEARVFGVPSLVCQNEVFWGNDSLEDLARFLRGEENFDMELFYERTKDIQF